MDKQTAYQKSSTCGCGGIPTLIEAESGGFQIECMACKSRGPEIDTAEGAVRTWNGMITALVTKQTYLEAMGIAVPKPKN